MKKTIKKKTLSRGSLVPAKGLLDKVNAAAAQINKANFPQFKGGDTLRVHVRIKEGDKERVQIYEGLCIGIQGRGPSRTFNVRKMSHGVGVERIFLFSTPKIAKVEVVQSGQVRRAKLYYIRELEGRAAKIERENEAFAAPVKGEPKA